MNINLSNSQNKNIYNFDMHKCLYLFGIFCLVILNTTYVFAVGSGDDAQFTTKFCNVAGLVKGPIGTGICTIAIAGAGAGFLGGKMDWKTLAIIVGGVLTIFFASDIVSMIAGEGLGNCPT